MREEHSITILDTEGNEYSNVLVSIKDEWNQTTDFLAAITEAAIQWCSDNGISYAAWE